MEFEFTQPGDLSIIWLRMGKHPKRCVEAKKMFIVLVSFRKSLEMVNQHLTAHRSFLDECYEKNYFIASGQNEQGTGGVIISKLNIKSQLEEVIKQDPLYIHGIADYEVIEFTPTKYHQEFSSFIG